VYQLRAQEYNRFEAFTLVAPPAFEYKREIDLNYVLVRRFHEAGYQKRSIVIVPLTRVRRLVKVSQYRRGSVFP
jgi:hypothetical protein